MPRVKQKKMALKLDPKNEYKATVIYFNFDNQTRSRYSYHSDSEEERFYVDLKKQLPDVASALGIETVRGKTLEEAEKAFDKAIKDFKNMSKEENRVILYSLIAGPLPEDHPGYSKYHMSNNAMTVEIWAGTYIETKTTDGNGNERYSYDTVEDGFFLGARKYGYSLSGRNGDRYEKQVPWTERNATFFLWIKERMNELILAVGDLSQQDKLIEAINYGKLLPLGRE